MKPCVQCGLETDSKYCPDCGQKQNIPRLTFKFFAEDFLDRIYGLNGTVPKTIIGLFKNPGYVIQEYIAGVRRKYVGPVGFYFLMYATFLLMFPILDIEMNDYMPSQETFNTPIQEMTGEEIDSESLQRQYEVRKTLFDNIQFFLVLWFPFIAIWAKILYRSSGYNFIENMVFVFFVSAQTTIFNMLGVLFYFFTGLKVLGLVMVLGIGYFSWAAATHFKGKSKIKLALKSVLMWVASYVSFFIFFMLLVGIIVLVAGIIYGYLEAST